VTASPTDAIIAEIEARYERAYLQQPSLHRHFPPNSLPLFGTMSNVNLSP
jgi:hypothetical protein